ncbi:MAG TPA: four helix bundle protein, partial [Flavisolibacter sp.]|nr:four helix bundle protein [Flavisolibacter sp.]
VKSEVEGLKSKIGGIKRLVDLISENYTMIKTLSDLDVFNLSYKYANEIFIITRSFPREEIYSLTDQVIRSSRSIAANIAEGWGKRTYENEFKKHLVYATGSLEETKVWLLFSKDCKYITTEKFQELFLSSDELGAKIYKLYQTWKTIN